MGSRRKSSKQEPRAQRTKPSAGTPRARPSQALAAPRPVAANYTKNDVVKDPLDLRDSMYEGHLLSLPPSLDNRERVPLVLNQQTEGACTGFALAAVANYLLRNNLARPLPESTSPRMFYEMARRYDEWPGESYSGSSVRGAMKGWKRHGVCAQSEWPYVPNEPGRLTEEAQVSALGVPLGGYFRVRHLHLNHMHAALREVGILLASAQVHSGWQRVAYDNPKIECSKQGVGAHAFAIVGYDADGFWVQNSWGAGWGRNGFAHLSYEDWLENGWDCWVAQLGVPMSAMARGLSGLSGRSATLDYLPDEAVVLSEIRGHFINLGNDGQLSQSGRYSTTQADVAAAFRSAAQALDSGRASQIMLYAHGGLNSETESARRIASMRACFLANGIYPIHFMWETGLLETVCNLVREALQLDRRTQGLTDALKRRFVDLLDAALELAARPLGRPLWNEMKENALRASADDGGATLAATQLAHLLAERPRAGLHLVGHSAGSIFHAHLLQRLVALGLSPQSLTLFAPACTTQLFTSHIRPHLGQALGELHLMNLTDQAELDDSVGPYQKSLLYLVGRSFEKTAPGEGPLKSILGMEQGLEDSNALRGLKKLRTQGDTTVCYSIGPQRPLVSNARTHGGFDNDPATLNSMLRILRGGKRPLHKFG